MTFNGSAYFSIQLFLLSAISILIKRIKGTALYVIKILI